MESLSEKQRWVIFLLIAVGIFMLTMTQDMKKQQALVEQQKKEAGTAQK